MFKLKTLANQTDYLLASLKDTKAITAIVLVKVGSRYEPAKVNGISHFIEHLLFKGTKKRPTSLHISKELDGIGADYNAFTSKQNTGYYIKANKEHLELALEMLADIIFNPLFEGGEIERERGVILEEIKMYEDNPLMHIGNVFEAAAFAGHPLANDIAGPKTVIQKVSRREIIDFYKKYYVNNRLVVGLSGNFEEDRAEKLIKKYFSKKTGRTNYGSFEKFINNQKQPRIKIFKKDTQQVQAALGFPAYKNTDPKVYPLTLLAIILGGGMSSRLFTEIREKRGLCYFVRASTNLYEDTGNLVIQAGLDQSRLKPALLIIKKELIKIKTKGIALAELKRAKEFLKGKLILQLEDSEELIHWLAEQKMMTGKAESLEVKLKKIEQVGRLQVNQVAKEIINFNKVSLGLIGPDDNESDFLKILKT